MAADLPDMDAQDVAEVFDEDNLDGDMTRLSRNDEELNFDDMPEVYDVTSAQGDADDDDGAIGDDLDDEEIVELSLQDEDENEDEADDDDYRAADSSDDEDVEGPENDEVGLSFGGDLNTTLGAHSAAQRYESRQLSDQDLQELGYNPAAEPRSFAKDQDVDPAPSTNSAHQEEALDEGLKETFPASDPVAVKHIS
jgi:hypothetical protein